MRLSRFVRRPGWRLLALPLAVWFGVTAAGAAGVAGLEHANHDGLAVRFHQRVDLVSNFVATYVANLVERQRRQAVAFLSDPHVSPDVFERVLKGLGFPAAVLLDGQGRLLLTAPSGSVPPGTDMTARYPHLRAAAQENRTTISTVLPSVAQGVPVINFALPFGSATGRRVFAVSVGITDSPLSAYLATSIPPGDILLHLVDGAGATVAANRTADGRPEPVAAPLEDQPGRYHDDGGWRRYTSAPVNGTPWRLFGAITEDYLYGPVAGPELASRVAVVTAAGVGLLVVAAVSRTRRGRRQLERANAQMADFVTMLGHDVRQPLSTMMLHTELLRDEWADLDEDARLRSLRQISACGHRADELVDEVLTLAQLDAGVVTARPERLDVARCVREAVDTFAFEPGYRVTVDAPQEAVATADAAFLRLILGNLIGNAVKYGRPPLDITVTDAGNNVTVEVDDQGEGVPTVFVPQLFDRFARAASGVAVTKPGTGLGLYLVQQLATASGLTIAYLPRLPHGASFRLTLPAAGTLPDTRHPGWRSHDRLSPTGTRRP